jgi:diguanylate cyclase (GGDEF)-like protein
MHEEILPNKKLTVSMGISSFPEDGLLPAELITAADKFLYQAKNKGRNKICY